MSSQNVFQLVFDDIQVFHRLHIDDETYLSMLGIFCVSDRWCAAASASKSARKSVNLLGFPAKWGAHVEHGGGIAAGPTIIADDDITLKAKDTGGECVLRWSGSGLVV